MIHFSHIYKTYPGPVHALRDVNITIENGEFIYMTGPSGAGKTTLFKLLAAYDRPTSGSVSVLNYDLNRITEGEVPYYRRKIGVVYQDFRLLKNRNIFENVVLPLEIMRVRPSKSKALVNELLDFLGLMDKSDAYPEQLSGGEQQRVAIARALIHKPGILIADEPTGNLDPAMSAEIIDLFDKVNAQGTTVFIATHDHQLVKERAKRVIHIEKGQMSEVKNCE